MGRFPLEETRRKIQNLQNIRAGEFTSLIHQNYTNYVFYHGNHVFKTAKDVAMSAMCSTPYEIHDIPHCKFVLHF